MAMSAAAAAKRRRVMQTTTPQPAANETSSFDSAEKASQNSRGLTLQQVIGVIDARLNALENYMMESKQMGKVNVEPVSTPSLDVSSISEIVNETVSSYTAEFNERYEILANEIMQLKDIIINLQSYTMDVNKMLLENRTIVMSKPIDHDTDSSENIFMEIEDANYVQAVIPVSREEPVAPQIEEEPVAPQIEEEQVAPQIEEEQVSPQIEEEQVSPQIEEEQVAPQIEEEQVAPVEEEQVAPVEEQVSPPQEEEPVAHQDA